MKRRNVFRRFIGTDGSVRERLFLHWTHCTGKCLMESFETNPIIPRSPIPLPLDANTAPSHSLHRIGEVCRREGVSDRSAARQLGMRVSEVKRQQKHSTDLRLSDLYRWQQMLEVPLEELLSEPTDELSPALLTRARLVRLMKSARAIDENASTKSTRRLAKRMIDQLLEIMPELKAISAWHSVGQRRGLNELGRIMERRLPDDLLYYDAED